MAKQKYYVVWQGRKQGVYATWSECQQQVNAFDGAKFKSYESLQSAETALAEGWKKHWGQGKAVANNAEKSNELLSASEMMSLVHMDSISVDVGTRGNPGPIEYKGVDTATEEIIFQVGPIAKGTNNLGEFIAIVHALAYLKEHKSNKVVYSDSKTALKWVKEKRVASSLVRDASTEEIWKLTDRAVQWLENNTYANPVLKWNTKQWGEIKADFGRK